jgi:hypothetical protein
MSKKLLAVAVALCVAVPSTFAAWDYFPVIEQGSAEANITTGAAIKIRYGLMENLELFSANYSATEAPYTIGVRYQIAPELFSAYADVAVADDRSNDWGVTPGVQFSTNFTDMISLGAGASLPVHLNHPGAADNGVDDGLRLDLGVGFEVDFAFGDQITLWVGVDFEYLNLTQENHPDLELKEALSPAIGLTFSRDNLSVGTWLGIGLNATNDKGKDSIGLSGGVDFGVKF